MALIDDAAGDFANEFDQQPQQSRWAVGSIQNVTPGGAADGRALVTVNIRGSVVAATCNYDLTLAASNTVLVLLMQAYPIVVCRLGSFPPV